MSEQHEVSARSARRASKKNTPSLVRHEQDSLDTRLVVRARRILLRSLPTLNKIIYCVVIEAMVIPNTLGLSSHPCGTRKFAFAHLTSSNRRILRKHASSLLFQHQGRENIV